MKKMFVVYAVLMLSYMINADAQNLKKDNVQRYIERYRSLAMSEQQRTGMPAAIKLAQGIHETGAGSSKLATEANNHFGLKCKNDWRGATYKYTDDAPNECFRKYNLDFESYQDQSNYLKGNPRYASLFSLSVTDYAAWAFGLHKAGYATNPKYPLLLIKIIEDYKLQEYTYAAMGGPENIADNVAVAPVENAAQPSRSRRATTQTYAQEQPAQDYPAAETPRQRSRQSTYGYQATTPQANITPIDNTPPERVSKYLDTRPQERQTITRSNQNGRTVEQPVERPNTIVKMNNLKAVYGTKGDMPLQYAVRNGIRYEKFLEMNDLEDKPLAADMPLYLERKHFWGIRPMHLVKFGETMHLIAQKEGIQLKYLRDLNYIEEDEEPVPGATLELQAQAGTKPQVEKRKEEAIANTQQNSYQDNSPNSSEAYTNPRYSGGNNNYQADNSQNSKYYQDNAQQQYAAPPVSTFPKNPAPPYQEEKPLWEKMKETRLARKLQKEYEAIASQQQTQQQAQQPVQQPASTKAVYKPNPAAQVQNEQPVREPKRKEKNIEPIAQQQEIQQQPAQQPTNSRVTYKPNPAGRLQYEQPANEPAQQQYQQPVAQQPKYQQPAQQPVAQQPVAQPSQSYRSQQYSYSTTATTAKPNPAAEVAEEKPARESKRRGKNKEVAAPVAAAKPQAQRPKTELDLLKEQFDNVIYAQNTPPAKSQPQQPRQQSYQQQTQPAYQQPAQQTYQQPVQREDAYAQQTQQPAAEQTQQQEERVDPSKLYTVQNGDTAYTIAKRHGITIRQLMDWNGLDFDAIKEGQTLRVKP